MWKIAFPITAELEGAGASGAPKLAHLSLLTQIKIPFPPTV